jgi:adenylosuccinate synthase
LTTAHPYTTWSTTTFANAETLLAEAGQTGTRLGVIRCYMTRHGPGPFVTEDPTLELADTHNQNNPWQGQFRVGHLDGVALRYAIEAAGGVHAIALTHLDVAPRRPDLKICHAYQIEDRVLTRLTPGPPQDLEYQDRLTAMLVRARPVYDDPGDDWPAVIEHETGAPVTLRSYGPTALDKQMSRAFASTRTTS